MKVLGFISGIVTLVLTYLTSQQIFGNGYLKFAPVLMLASSSFFALWAVDGLETVFYTMLLSLLLYFLNSNQSPLKLGFLLGVILLTRPEGVLFSALVIYYFYFRNNLSYVLKIVMVVGLIFLAQIIFRWSYYHELLANTALNKLHPGLHSIIEGIKYLLKFNQDSGYLILPLALIGIFNPNLAQKLRFTLLMFVIGQLIFIMVSGGDFMYGFRFIIPILPILCVLTTSGLQTIFLKKQVLTKILMIGLLITWNAIIQFQNLPHKTININNLTYRSSPHFLIGNYLKKRSKPEDLVLLSGRNNSLLLKTNY
ncbi:hypothetical protein [Legionella wadsworthii]|nr:hypothetical protein [Legionella wadsworthii]